MLYDPKWKPTRKEQEIEITTLFVKRKDLTEAEITSLLRVREALRNGTIPAKRFKMEVMVGRETRCGTHGCLGGWLGILAMLDDGLSMKAVNRAAVAWDGIWGSGILPGTDLEQDRHTKYFRPMRQKKFRPLFYPSDYSNYNATPEDGIKAIDRFLGGERKPWDFPLQRKR